ncbi:MAG: choice-of-anchor I family protein [Bacteroidota bacterium]
MRKTILFAIIFLAMGATAFGQVSLNLVGTYRTNIFDDSAAEIVAFDSASQRLFVVNGADATVDILDISTPTTPTLVSQVDVTPYGENANSVASYGGFIAAAIKDSTVGGNGTVAFLDNTGMVVNTVKVGVLPDMAIFSPNGNWLLTANEGEPSDDYTIDPLGSVSIIDVSGGIANVTQADVTTLDFTAFNSATLDPSIRIFGNNGTATVAEDLEPEYIAISPNSQTAYVVCQENNALAVVDINAKSISTVLGLGFKDHNAAGNGIDASNDAVAVNIANWPIKGMYQPDAITQFATAGSFYLITANEGDARDYDAYSEEVRVRDLNLDATAFPNAALLQEDTLLGRLRCTDATGDTDNDGDFDEIYSFGARSFTIWDSAGNLVYDSGDEIEQRTLSALPAQFNSNNDDNDSYKSRSDDKGPEPEAVTVATINGKVLAFIGLERIGGIMVYDVTDPTAPIFETYYNNRNFSVDADSSAAGDLGPEGLLYIPATAGLGNHLLVSANEISGTVSLYSIDVPVSVTSATETRYLNIYPNPAGDKLHLSQPVPGKVIDLQGRMLLRSEGARTLDLRGLTPGMYLFRAYDGTNKKFIHQ